MQDRILVPPNAVAVLDGASGTADGERDGGWYADQLVAQLGQRLPGDTDLRTVLRDSIAAVTEAHQLTPGTSPSSTVAIARWDAETVDVLVLGDTTVVTFTTDGQVAVIEDDRLTHVAQAERAAYRNALAAGQGFGPDHRRRLRRLVEEQRRWRNRDGGYWIAETDPAAANYAITRQFHIRSLDAIVLATDGAAAGVNRYGRPPDWRHALALVLAQGPDHFLETIDRIETDDPDGKRWPRSKRHDDKAIAVRRFSHRT